MSETGERQRAHPSSSGHSSRRQHLYRLAELYDRCVIRAWTTRDVAGMEDEHRAALERLEVARRRMDRAGRGLPPPRDKADYR